MTEEKKICVSSLVLGIVGTVLAFFVPAAAYSCSITGLALGARRRKTHSIGAGIALNIIALVIAGANSALGILCTLKMFGDDEEEE